MFETEPRLLMVPSGTRYELRERIGSGGAGVVYRAVELGTGTEREVCVKRLPYDTVEGVRALREEARLLARVRHANVVSLLAVGQEPLGSPFLVLELVQGADLRSLCRAAIRAGETPKIGLVPDRLAVHIACVVLRALGAVERAIPGLVHRDVSPSNILVSNEGEVKLTDFGIALATDRDRWTRPSLVKGKLGYVSPEQLRGEPFDGRADLFAVGVVLYELLAGRRPFRARTPFEEMRAIEQGDRVPLGQFRPDLERGLVEHVERLLEPRAIDRFASADDALRAFASYSAGELASLRLRALVRLVFPERRDEAKS